MRLKLIAAVAAVACAVSGAPARADWLYAKWGMTPEQVVAASGGAVQVLTKAERSRQDAIHMEMAARGTLSEGDLQMHVVFGFDTRSGGLCFVVYSVPDASQNDKLKAWLIKHFGPPDEVQATVMDSAAWTRNDRIQMMVMFGSPATVTHEPHESN